MFVCFRPHPEVLAQPVSLSVNNTSLTKVFTLIEKQTGVSFFYRVEALKKARKVTVNVSNVSLKNALDLCFKNQPLVYQIIDKTIVVKEKPLLHTSQKPSLQSLQRSSVVVHGQIVTTDGEPVEMATVSIKGKKKAVYSNADGKFSVNIDDSGAVLMVSCVSIEPVEVAVKNDTNLTILVNAKSAELDPVQIIGYGQTTRRFNTGNVTTIKSDEIEKQPVNNILAALEGRLPGLVVTQKTGITSGGFDLVFRGRGTISAGSDPLVIVDGVPIPLDLYRGFATNKFHNSTAKAGGSPLSLLNVGDIDRVDMLKDADATAIYGSRGANGVILITTKKGKPGKTRFNLNTYSGFSRIGRQPKMLNLQQYLEMRREAKKNDNAQVTALDVDINGTWDTTRYTDWSKELLGGSAAINEVQLSISGGSHKSNYLLSGTYHRETTVMPTTGADRNVSIYFNASTESRNKKVHTTISAAYLSKKDNLQPVDFTGSLHNYIPNQPSSFLDDGSLNYGQLMVNPYKKLKELYKMNAMNVLGSWKISYRPVSGLELGASLGFNKQYQHDFYGIPKVAQSLGSMSTAKYSANRLTTIIIEPQASYSINLKHNTKLSALFGSTYQNSFTSYKVSTASGFSDDALLHDPQYAASQVRDSSYKNYKYLGSFSRLSFNHANKYLVNLTGRIDGTSRFGSEKQSQPFGAVGLGWIFSEEAFMKKVSWVHMAKLRGSYGIIGNSEIRDYSFSPVYVPVFSTYQGVTGLDPNQLYNPRLGWELKKALEIAVELQLFKNRVDVSVSLYRNLNSDQLVIRSVSAVTGFSSVLENGGTLVENKGVEIVLGYSPFRGPAFSWNITANATFSKNTLRSFDGIENTPYSALYSVGQPLTSLKVYRFGGVDPAHGTYFFLDRNGKPTTTLTIEDKVGVVNTDPKAYGSITSSLTYNQFSLDVNCMFMRRRGRAHLEKFSFPPGVFLNQPVEVLSRWQKQGDISDVARYTQLLSAATFQNFNLDIDNQYTNASYLRVKNISVSYSFKKKLSKRLHAEKLRFFLHAQNLFTFSPYKNLDPETTYFQKDAIVSRMPLLRTVTGGFQLTF
jgi:TonB-linked SusC/RagA family outer membrane protein